MGKMIRPDCFFLHDGRCTVLTKTDCICCRFGMPEKDFRMRQERTEQRLAVLGLERYIDGGIVTTRKRKEPSHDPGTT